MDSNSSDPPTNMQEQLFYVKLSVGRVEDGFPARIMAHITDVENNQQRALISADLERDWTRSISVSRQFLDLLGDMMLERVEPLLVLPHKEQELGRMVPDREKANEMKSQWSDKFPRL